MVARWLKKLTKVQREILTLMNDEGYFIISPLCRQPMLVRSDLSLVKKVDRMTLSVLSPVYVRESYLGTHGQFGRMYSAHKDCDMRSIIRSCEASRKASEKRRALEGKS